MRIFRIRAAYQFSRELSFRTIVEASRRKYYAEDGTLDELSKNVVVDLLLKYQLDPMTIFYIGWGNLFGANVDHDYRRIGRHFRQGQLFVEIVRVSTLWG